MGHADAYDLCAKISGRCGCSERGQRPCMAIEEMVENGQGPAEEAARLNWELQKAAVEGSE